MKNKNFTVQVDGKEVELSVRTPTANDRKEAQKVYNTAFTEALKSGAVVRAKLDDILVEQGLWNESKQIKFDTIQRQLNDNERKLEKGGISLSAAKEIAMEMRKLRAEFREVIADKTSLDTHSAEGQADSERFNYFVYACTCYPDGKKYFSSYKDYMERGDDPVSVEAASHLANLMYGLEADYESKLPENKFLKDYKFVDEKLRFINKDGKLTDSEGRLINENGRFIDEAGNFVDKYGNPLDEEGHYKVEFSPFLDDEGKPVILENEVDTDTETDKKNKKTASKKKTTEPKEE